MRKKFLGFEILKFGIFLDGRVEEFAKYMGLLLCCLGVVVRAVVLTELQSLALAMVVLVQVDSCRPRLQD